MNSPFILMNIPFYFILFYFLLLGFFDVILFYIIIFFFLNNLIELFLLYCYSIL